ncbi:MAG: hypothetical protein LAT52_10645 [Balneolales bacterium]|nr:hypothetical protein [Balneolales bacterium]
MQHTEEFSQGYSMKWITKGSLSARLLSVLAFVVAYFVVLRFVRIFIIGVMVYPVATSIDAGRDNGFLVYHERGTTGVYVYSERYLESVSGGGEENGRSGELLDHNLSDNTDDSGDNDLSQNLSQNQEQAASATPSAVQARPDRPVGMESRFGDKPFYLFKGFGDQFFLVGGVALLFMGFARHAGYLFGYHIVVSVLNVGLLFVGLLGFESALRLMDFVIEYLTPAVSMLWIVMVYATRAR